MIIAKMSRPVMLAGKYEIGFAGGLASRQSGPPAVYV
jgi:hypothetical protein